MGSFNEILKSFDLPVVFPEINSLQTAVKKVAHGQEVKNKDALANPESLEFFKNRI